MGHQKLRGSMRTAGPGLRGPVIEDVLEVKVGSRCFITEVGRLPGSLQGTVKWHFCGPHGGDRWELERRRAKQRLYGEHWYAVAYVPGSAGPCSLAIKKAPNRNEALEGVRRMLVEFCQRERPQTDAAALGDIDERLSGRALGTC